MIKNGCDLFDKVAKKRKLFFAEPMSSFWFSFLTRIIGFCDILQSPFVFLNFMNFSLVFLHSSFVFPCFCCFGVKF